MKDVLCAFSHSTGGLSGLPPYSAMNSSSVYAWPSLGSTRLSMPLAKIRRRLVSTSSSEAAAASSSSRCRSSRWRRSSFVPFFFLSFMSTTTSGGGGRGGASASSSSESNTLIGANFLNSSKLSDVNCFCCFALNNDRLPLIKFNTSVAMCPLSPSTNFLCAMMSYKGPGLILPSFAAWRALYNQRSRSLGFFGNTSSQSKLTYSSFACCTSSLETFFFLREVTSPGTMNISSSRAFFSSLSCSPHLESPPTPSSPFETIGAFKQWTKLLSLCSGGTDTAKSAYHH
mmetsp:Transcript_99437/g.195332  ORF Transcript_99437/g.195332 Transcript_99437/m.195332 type:complete len:286 (-) Transcript_99437:12-869(-)